MKIEIAVVINPEELPEKYRTIRPPKYKRQVKYDQTTGKKIAVERVLTRGSEETFFLNNKKFDDNMEFTENEFKSCEDYPFIAFLKELLIVTEQNKLFKPLAIGTAAEMDFILAWQGEKHQLKVVDGINYGAIKISTLPTKFLIELCQKLDTLHIPHSGPIVYCHLED